MDGTYAFVLASAAIVIAVRRGYVILKRTWGFSIIVQMQKGGGRAGIIHLQVLLDLDNC